MDFIADRVRPMPPRDTNEPQHRSASRCIYRCMLSYENITATGRVFYHRKPLTAMASATRKGRMDIVSTLVDAHSHDLKQGWTGLIRRRCDIGCGRDVIEYVVRQPIF